MKNLFLLFIFFIFFNACNSLKDAGKTLRNEKIKTTDEFLVKKRNPLVLPPNYEQLPEPGSILKKKENEKNNIKKILNLPELEKEKNRSSSIEESILDKIRK